MRIAFQKMSGTGNDFVMIDNRRLGLGDEAKSALVRSVCPRRLSVGADGAIFVEPPTEPGHDYRMRFYNADGGEAEMCGNGARCLAVFARAIGAAPLQQRIQTLAGTVLARVLEGGRAARIQLSPPSPLRELANVPLLGEKVCLYALNTGVPHALEFVTDLAGVDVRARGAAIRRHECFQPAGTNANFVQLLGENQIRIRTFERGVEDETLACGTGATAAALAAGILHGYRSPVRVWIAAGDCLTIHFDLDAGSQGRPLLEGAVRKVYRGEYLWPEVAAVRVQVPGSAVA